MFDSYTPGSVLLLIGEHFAKRAEEARAVGSDVIADNLKQAEATMNVVGFGLDAILPKPTMR
jgi:hypothetical protein